jgi:ferritin-like protein
MDLKKVLETGLKMEESARDFYQRSMEAVVHPGAKAMLKFLVDEEVRHVQMFQDALAGKEVDFGAKAPAVGQDLKIGEYLIEPTLTDSSDPAEIITIAIKAEMRAIKFYSESAAHFVGTEAEKLLSGLVAEEKAHKAQLERLYDDEFLQEN